MKIHNCKVYDNYSLFVTHGITLTKSKLFIDLTYFNFSEELLARLDSLKLDKLDTGIFNLQLSSELTLGRGTAIRQVTAAKYSVLSSRTQSSVVLNNVIIYENYSGTSDGYTMYFYYSKDIEIRNSFFMDNPQINIAVI